MDRQFTEDEAREVFARAAERQHAVGTGRAGLSLDELRAIGAEAGLDPEFVEAAARSVALGEPERGRMSLGPLPRGVSRTALLPGPSTDALWQQVVADARRTFSAQGKVSGSGRIREWRNGNLRVSLEPAGDGTRLHLQTRRDDRVQGTAILAVVAVCATVSLLFTLIGGGFDLAGSASLLMGASLATLASVGFGVGQRRWARERERQMDGLIQRTSDAAALAPPAGEPLAAPAPAPADATEGAGRIDPALLDDAPLADDEAGRDRRRVR